MRRLAASLIAIALPVSAFAAFLKPSDVFTAVQFKGKPLDIAHELHANYEGTFASAWLKGAVEGDDLKTAKADLKMTMDVAGPDGNLRVRVQARVVSESLYVLLDGIEGTFANELSMYATAGREYRGKWYQIPLHDVQTQAEQTTGVNEEDATAIVKAVVDAIFSLDRMNDIHETTYSMKLKRTAAKDLQTILAKLAKEYPNSEIKPMTNREVAEARRMFARTQLHIKVITDVDDRIKSLKHYLSAKHQGFHAVLQGMTTIRTAPVSVRVPANAIPIDEFSDAHL